MNSDFIQSALVKIVIAAGTYWATKEGLSVDGSTWQTIGGALAVLAAAGYRLYQAWDQKKVPAASTAVATAGGPAPVGATVTGKVVGCLAFALIAFGGLHHAEAQTAPVKVQHKVPMPRPQPSASALAAFASTQAPAKQLTAAQVQANPIALGQQFTVADLQAAIDDANAQVPPDTIATACYAAIMPIVQAGVPNPLPAGPGVFQAAQKVRDAQHFVANLQSPTGPLANLVSSCAQWTLDGVNLWVMIGAKVGLVASTAGVGGALPFPLPFPLPLH